MSLNEFFAANAGNVYLRPVGLPDCFPLPGLPHGCKPPPPPAPPPPLAMQHPCPSGPQKPRTMATVSPLHQVVPTQPNLGTFEPTAANSLNAYGSSQRTSSFAAALRKLAKQAGDPITGEKDMTHISPVSSPVLAQRSLTPKRNGPSSGQAQSMYMSTNNNHQLTTSYPSSSPPVVTIAPSRPHAAHTSDSRKMQVVDMTGLPQSNANSSLSNGHMSDAISLKLDVSKSGVRTSAGDKWDDHTNKSMSTSSGTSQSRPHATIAPLPRPDDSLTSSRGFQPYRSAEDIRTSMPHHLSPFEHHSQASYPYAPAFLPPPHLPHPAYRFDDPLFLDRYGLLRSSVMPFPTQPAMMATPAAFYPQSRYDLLAQSLSLSNSSLLHQERLKLEEDRRQREKEIELDQSRKREQERREKEQKEKEYKEKEHHKEKEKERREKERHERHREKNEHAESNNSGSRTTHHSSSSHSKRNECSARRVEPHVPSTINQTSPTVTNSSAPLNLVVHPPTPENHKKEAELWVPWQPHQPSHQNKDNHEEGNIIHHRPPPLHPQENHKPSLQKDSSAVEKFQVPYNLPFLPDKKEHNRDVMANTLDNDPKKHFPFSMTPTTANNVVITNNVGNNNDRKFDSIHHHIAELSKRDNLSNEWKHEKLQKAYANNHRKNITEVKKLREESQLQNNTHSNVQRKVHVNGLIKPILSQDEGMHARLLETEKCRLECNSHSVNKLSVQNEKSSVPSLLPNGMQMNGKDVESSVCVENHILSVMPKVVEPVVLRSKLDKEADDMKRKGLQDIDYEEPPITDLLIITKGPALSLDTNPKKMSFLKILGLTSRLKRKKIEFDIYLKRRKILLEDRNLMPLDIEVEEKESQPNSLLESCLKLDKLSEKLRLETVAEKVEFLATLHLNPQTLAQKEEKVKMRKLVEEERVRRAQRLKIKLMKKSTSQQSVNSKDDTESTKAESKPPSESTSKSLCTNTAKSTYCSQNAVTAQTEQVPYVNAPTKEESGSCTKALQSTGADGFVFPQDASTIKRNSKFRTKYSFKRGHSLKCEWKPAMSALRSPNNHKLSNGYSLIKNEMKSNVHVYKSTATQVDSTLMCNNQADNKDINKISFNWPGLDAIIEAYYRHNKEQLMEKDVLQERCNQLRSQQEDLTKEANNLSKSMSDLIKLKRELDEKRLQYEQAIEKLKKFIQAAR